MTLRKKLLLAYCASVGVISLFGFFVLNIREMGLYLFVLFLNLPGSIVVVPLMEQVSSDLGWVAGKTAHVIATQAVCILINATFFIVLTAACSRIRRRPKEDSIEGG